MTPSRATAVACPPTPLLLGSLLPRHSVSPAHLPGSLTSPTVASCLPSGMQTGAWQVSAGRSPPGPVGPLPSAPEAPPSPVAPALLTLPLAPPFVLLDTDFLNSRIFSWFFLVPHAPPVIPRPPVPSEAHLSNSPCFFSFFSCPSLPTFLALVSLSVLLSHYTTGSFLIFPSATQHRCLLSTCYVPGHAPGPLTGSQPTEGRKETREQLE